jgi:hypothetical protein
MVVVYVRFVVYESCLAQVTACNVHILQQPQQASSAWFSVRVTRYLTPVANNHRLRQTYTPPDKPVAVTTENAAGEGQAGGTKKAKKNKQSREGVDDDGYVHDAGCACTVM